MDNQEKPQETQENKACDSTSSSSSSTITDVMEDASSSSSSLNGPLYELSDLMAHLPVKRGLSKYYDGKSESFTSMESVKSLEDLAKKEKPSYDKRRRMCNRVWSPKPTIAKKVSSSRGSFLSAIIGRNRI